MAGYTDAATSLRVEVWPLPLPDSCPLRDFNTYGTLAVSGSDEALARCKADLAFLTQGMVQLTTSMKQGLAAQMASISQAIDTMPAGGDDQAMLNNQKVRSLKRPTEVRRAGFPNPDLAREQQSIVHRTCRERIGSTTLQTLQYPILLLPWLCFRGCFGGERLTPTPPRVAGVKDEGVHSRRVDTWARGQVELERLLSTKQMAKAMAEMKRYKKAPPAVVGVCCAVALLVNIQLQDVLVPHFQASGGAIGGVSAGKLDLIWGAVRVELNAAPGQSTGCMMVTHMMGFSVGDAHATQPIARFLEVQRELAASLSKEALKRASSVTTLLFDWLCVIKRLIEHERGERLISTE
jgi:hypothetical protein